MIKSALVLSSMIFSTFLFAQNAQASRLGCVGSYSDFNFTFTAQLSKRLKPVGKVKILVTGPDRLKLTEDATATSSRIIPRRSVEMTAVSPKGSGAINAAFNSSTNHYEGTLLLHFRGGEFTMNTTCAIR